MQGSAEIPNRWVRPGLRGLTLMLRKVITNPRRAVSLGKRASERKVLASRLCRTVLPARRRFGGCSTPYRELEEEVVILQRTVERWKFVLGQKTPRADNSVR